jgi:hypothetical protein
MEALNSVVLWRDEAFHKIREVAESSLCVESAIHKLGLDVTYRSFLCTVEPNGADPNVQRWASSFSETCARLGNMNKYGSNTARMEFRLKSADPSQAISRNLDHILPFALGWMLPGKAMLHDVVFDDRLAAWSLQTLLPVDWMECCLVTVRTPRTRQVRIAYITSTDAYLLRGLIVFGREQYLRKRGLFSKPTYGINDLDDLALAMEETARYHGWKVKQLQMPG